MLSNGLTNAIRRQNAMIASHSSVFISILKLGKHSGGLAKIRNLLLKFVRKAYSQLIREQS